MSIGAEFPIAPASRVRRPERQGLRRAPFVSAILLLGVALAIGGAGIRYPMLELLIELASLLIIFQFVAGWSRPIESQWGKLALLLAGLILLLPLAQLIPLPPSLWHKFPGRDWTIDLLALVGSGNRWRPVTLDPESTRIAFLSMLPGAAMFIAVLQSEERDRQLFVKIVLAFAVLGALVGTLQAAGASAVVFTSGHAGFATGLFVNRNHHATFMNVAVILSAAVAVLGARSGSRFWSVAAGACLLVFVASVLATGSRTGAALLLISLPAAFLLLRPRFLRFKSAAYIATAVALLLALALGTSAGDVVVSRLSGSLEDPRLTFWSETADAIRQYWPLGSGFGTFVDVHQRIEPLSSVRPTYLNHAHNDYLELIVEGGVLALLVTLGGLFFLAWMTFRALASSSSEPWQLLARAAGLGLLVIAAHSVVDYPLRMLAIMTVFGLLAGLLIPPPQTDGEEAK